MNVIVAGIDDHDIAAAIEAEGHAVSRVDIANRPGLEEAGILETDAFVLTEMEQATTISVAKDLNEDLKVVVYAEGSLPEFATRQTDLMVDPALLDPEAVAAELSA
ncbi:MULTISPECIES: DUF7126 family protein [Salinibaculum]|uniref:DUF7126 family protein n=1 Tax=Salinibaculum TaxID=2732368 RepID=UPI0030CFEEA4